MEALYNMKIALMGGTFNPIHLGHLRVAEEVRERLGLDKVLFMPTFLPPHKADEMVIPAAMRLEMVRAAIEGNRFFEASDMEVKRGGRSFTVETLREMKSMDPSVEITLIIGNDSFNEITTWCEYEALFDLAGFAVVARPGYAVKKPGEVLPVELAAKFWYDPQAGSYRNSSGNSLTYLSATLLEISSSDIRARVKDGLSIRYLLPEPVAEYIAKKGLYK